MLNILMRQLDPIQAHEPERAIAIRLTINTGRRIFMLPHPQGWTADQGQLFLAILSITHHLR